MSLETPARIAIVGAGPIGLEAALYARYLGYDVDIYERGSIADSVLAWGHVRMFSPFGQNRSPLGLAALKAQDGAWQPPADDAQLTGREFAERYLIPLAHSDLLVDSLHEHTAVEAIGRDLLLKGELAADDARADHDFRLLLRSNEKRRPRPRDVRHGRRGDRRQRHVRQSQLARTGRSAGLGRAGGPTARRVRLARRVGRGSRTLCQPQHPAGGRRRFGGHQPGRIGRAGRPGPRHLDHLGHAARNRRDFAAAAGAAGSTIHCLSESGCSQSANRLAADDANHVTSLSGTVVESIFWHADLERFSVRLIGRHAGELEFDRIIANVGYRPDDGLCRELHVSASAVSGGTFELVTDEPDFYVLGAKSRGRDSRFLIADGLKQIRELFTIIGDRAELDLYATMANLADTVTLTARQCRYQLLIYSTGCDIARCDDK